MDLESLASELIELDPSHESEKNESSETGTETEASEAKGNDNAETKGKETESKPETEETNDEDAETDTEGSEDNESGENAKAKTKDTIKVDLGLGEVEVTLEEAEKLLKQTAIKPKSSVEKYIETNGISKDDLALLAAVKAGDLAAIKKLAGDADLYDIADLEVKKDYKFEEPDTSIDDFVATMNKSSIKTEVENLVSTLPETDVQYMVQNPKTVEVLENDHKAGVYESTMAEAKKMVTLNGGSVLDAYADIRQRQTSSNAKKQIQKKVVESNRQKESVKNAKSSKGGQKKLTLAEELALLKN